MMDYDGDAISDEEWSQAEQEKLDEIYSNNEEEELDSDEKIRPVRFFCKKCGKELWQGMSKDNKKCMTIDEAERTCICSDCLLEDIRDSEEGGDEP